MGNWTKRIICKSRLKNVSKNFKKSKYFEDFSTRERVAKKSSHKFPLSENSFKIRKQESVHGFWNNMLILTPPKRNNSLLIFQSDKRFFLRSSSDTLCHYQDNYLHCNVYIKSFSQCVVLHNFPCSPESISQFYTIRPCVEYCYLVWFFCYVSRDSR